MAAARSSLLLLLSQTTSHRHTSICHWRYSIEHLYPRYELIKQPADDPKSRKEAFLSRVSCRIDASRFPSKSQARRACQHGRIVIIRRWSSIIGAEDTSDEDLLELGFIGESDTIMQNSDVVAIRTRIPDEYYPLSSTRYVDPPPDIVKMMPIDIIYEDDYIAIANKPELVNTIGRKRMDLQSMLPFILRPPPLSQLSPPLKTPRPVHRLDRKTSGCVIVAKTQEAMTRFNKMFASRKVQKSYVAVVFGIPRGNDKVGFGGDKFATIDYPIDGKDAVTLWKTVSTVTSPEWGTLSLVHLMPKTGRTHQIRRHFSYCLGCAIVGDSKYDGGRERARSARAMGMFLCAISVEFTHELMDRQIVAKISLPDIFYKIMGCKSNSKDII